VSFRPLIIVGTRPETIKLAPVIRAFRRLGVRPIVVHTGQHYDYELSRVFFQELDLGKPDYTFRTGPGTHAEQTAEVLVRIEKILLREQPDVTVVQGDTNTVLAGALASVKLKIPVAHVEAGLRSFDRTMPEEVNRVLTDHASEVLFSPTEEARRNLEREGITENVYVVGNTIVDAVRENAEVAEKKSDVLKRLNLESRRYLLITAHRAENTESKENLERLVEILKDLPMRAVYPMHPRTRKKLEEFGLMDKLEEIENLIVTKPLGYLDFLKLEKNAFAVMTDSGGLQEESIILGVPCLTLRYNTERPETVSAGGNILVGLEKDRVLFYLKRLMVDQEFYKKMSGASNPFGDGRAGERIAGILLELHEKGELKVKSSRFI